MTMVNLFRRTSGASPILTFRNSTNAGIEQMLRKFKDAVMIVDDLMPSGSPEAKRKIESSLEHIIRLFGDGIGATRNTDFFSKEVAERVNYHTEGLCLFTGEYFCGVASSRSRCIVLQFARDTVDNNLLRFYQDHLDILPGFLWNLYGIMSKPDARNFIHNIQVTFESGRDF